MENYLPTIESDRINDYAWLTVERHKLLLASPEELEESGGTEELWRVEDKMAKGWQLLSEAERQSVSGLASDLAWVRRKGDLAPNSHSSADVSLEDVKLLIQSLIDGQVYQSLHYVRVCLPFTGNHLAAMWRSRLYRQAFSGVANSIFDGFAEMISLCFGHPNCCQR